MPLPPPPLPEAQTMDPEKFERISRKLMRRLRYPRHRGRFDQDGWAPLRGIMRSASREEIIHVALQSRGDDGTRFELDFGPPERIRAVNGYRPPPSQPAAAAQDHAPPSTFSSPPDGPYRTPVSYQEEIPPPPPGPPPTQPAPARSEAQPQSPAPSTSPPPPPVPASSAAPPTPPGRPPVPHTAGASSTTGPNAASSEVAPSRFSMIEMEMLKEENEELRGQVSTLQQALEESKRENESLRAELAAARARSAAAAPAAAADGPPPGASACGSDDSSEEEGEEAGQPSAQQTQGPAASGPGGFERTPMGAQGRKRVATGRIDFDEERARQGCVSVSVGDELEIKSAPTETGWVHVRNATKNKEGWVPAWCVPNANGEDE